MINKERFYYGRPCYAEQHQNDNGTNLRIEHGGCCQCMPRYSGLTDDEIIEISSKPRQTPEQCRLKQIIYSRDWTKRNMDKHAEYVRKYNQKESTKEMRKQRWANLPAERKKEIAARQKALYDMKKALKDDKLL